MRIIWCVTSTALTFSAPIAAKISNQEICWRSTWEPFTRCLLSSTFATFVVSSTGSIYRPVSFYNLFFPIIFFLGFPLEISIRSSIRPIFNLFRPTTTLNIPVLLLFYSLYKTLIFSALHIWVVWCWLGLLPITSN